MRLYGWLLIALGICGCPNNPPPAPIPPDAADAAPTIDGATSTCAPACATLSSLCGAQQPDCVAVFARIDGARLIRTPSGAPLTCAAVASAHTAQDIQALGVHCGP